MLKRIFKMLAAQGAGIGVLLLTQFLLPPIFLHSYGVSGYGEWLVLSAAISYLSTLNFGVTTYASNQLTILRQQNDLEQYRRLQASTLSIIAALIAGGTVICVVVALLPLNRLLDLHGISRAEAGLTALFFGLQMMAQILGGYYNNLFMVVQETHRGTMWWNARRLGATLAAAALAIFHQSFAIIAFGQFVAVLLIAILALVDLKVRMKGMPLGFAGADWVTAKSTLKPSGMFALVYMQTFLLFQAPVILLQWLLGPEIVVLFTISRTVLSTARQFLSTITSAIAPEITFSFGGGDMKKLLDIFHYSERLVFSLIPVANLGALLFSPLLLDIWLHKPALFETYTYALMALVSAVMSMREHKQYFQYSTNVHYRLALIVFWGNLAMISVSIPTTYWFGLHGFMITWLVSEAAQMGLLYRENKKLFGDDASITLMPAFKLVLFLACCLPLCLLLVDYGRTHSLVVSGLLATGGTALIFAASYLVFGLNVVRRRFARG
ncbi:MAG TPA: hypothetical protein VHX13_06445 [Acidobacteriaceae bacterium]|jgi:O-antigen/teichoic acid export membrane protein|nr:hypothetical protein [Acidobacteriaceae bacterium]